MHSPQRAPLLRRPRHSQVTLSRTFRSYRIALTSVRRYTLAVYPSAQASYILSSVPLANDFYSWEVANPPTLFTRSHGISFVGLWWVIRVWTSPYRSHRIPIYKVRRAYPRSTFSRDQPIQFAPFDASPSGAARKTDK